MLDGNEEAEVVKLNDLLCFMQCKMDILPKDTLTKITHSFYSKEAIVKARKDVMEVLPDGLGRIPMHINKSDIVDNLYDTLQKLASEKPTRVFACRNVNNLPAISMKEIDPVMILTQTNEM